MNELATLCSPPRSGYHRAEHSLAGLPLFVQAIRFNDWARSLRSFPMPEQVMDRFNVSRPTAHRWCNALAEAWGVERPRRDCRGVVREVADL